MMKTAVHRFAIGGSGNLAVAIVGFHDQIVAPGSLGGHAKRIQRREHDSGRNGFVVFRFARHKGKAGIAEVVEYRAAAAAAPGQPDVVLFHAPGIALLPRVLRAANHHGVGVAPQKQHPLGGRHLAENTLLDREVKPGVVGIGEQQAERRHRISFSD